MRRLLVFLSVLLLLPGLAEARITQRDWALQLIDSLGWSFGLPEKPTDQDYQRMLDGNRTYRIEAEEAHQRGDRVAVMNFDTFGEFSGKGWLNGIKDRTTAHFKFNLPHSGRFKVTARVRLVEHHLLIGTRDFRVSGGDMFTTVQVGFVELQAGPNEAIFQLRPNGSIDYFELEAAPVGPIAPAGGWEFDRELSAEVAARTTIQALNLQKNLPPGRQVLRLEAENLPLPKGVRIERNQIRGDASGGRFVQVGAGVASLAFYAASVADGVADIALRAAGTRPISTRLVGYFDKRQTFGQRFEERLLGTFFLPEGEMLVEVELPSRASIDRLEIRSRRGSRADLLRLVGLDESGRISERDLNNLSALISRLRTLR